ncbi:MAG TPA: hypothetical protein DD706_23600 [Nitrospiraceae bacterium]|nr:hypothetical protein [Nitrospiraceae bacterium]
MSREDIKPGMAFRSAYVEEDIFFFAFPSLMIEGDGLYRRFNRVGGFVETDWYRFQEHASHLQRTEEFDFVG